MAASEAEEISSPLGFFSKMFDFASNTLGRRSVKRGGLEVGLAPSRFIEHPSLISSEPEQTDRKLLVPRFVSELVVHSGYPPVDLPLLGESFTLCSLLLLSCGDRGYFCQEAHRVYVQRGAETLY